MEELVQPFIIHFTSILWEAFPFIVLGALIAGVLEEMVPQQAIAKIVPRSKLVAIALGGVLGLVFPMCECGIVPIMRRLLRKGLPLGTCIAYLLAGPIINGVVILSTWVAFNGHGIAPEMVGLRVGMAFIVACTTAAVVEFFLYPKYGDELLMETARPPKPSPLSLDVVENDQPAAKKPLMKRLGNMSETALHDFVDIMVFLILGALLAAFVKVQMTPEDVQALALNHPAITIAAAMALAFVLCLCSEADAFVAASFTKLTVSAKLGFLVFGPMSDIKLVFLYTRVFRRRLILTIIPLVAVQVFAYSLIVHYVWDVQPADETSVTAPVESSETPNP